MQRNANMLKILKKVRFCRFYWFLCKKSSPLSVPRTNFCPSEKLCNTLCIMYLQSFKWALKKTLHRKVIYYYWCPIKLFLVNKKIRTGSHKMESVFFGYL